MEVARVRESRVVDKHRLSLADMYAGVQKLRDGEAGCRICV